MQTTRAGRAIARAVIDHALYQDLDSVVLEGFLLLLGRVSMKQILRLILCGALCWMNPVAANETTSVFTLDVDDNGELEPLTDGLLILRHLFGFSGSALTEGAVGENSKRIDAGAIDAHLTANRSAMDIDGDGEVRPLTDGLLILRHLFGFAGNALIDGAVGSFAERGTSSTVVAQLQTLMDTDGDGILDSDEDQPPVISLIGAASITLVEGDDYFDPGATALDQEDGPLSNQITVTGLGALKGAEPGQYIVRYEVIDSAGNAVFQDRAVVVTAEVEMLTVLGSVSDATSPLSLVGAPFEVIGAFDAGIDYNSCENDGGEGCPNMSWQIARDPDRGSVLQVSHSGAGKLAGLYLKTGPAGPVDLSAYGRGTLEFDVKIISGDPSMIMKVDCVYDCTSGDYALADASTGVWVTYVVEIDDLVAQGLELRNIDTGIVIWAAEFTSTVFQLDNVRWRANIDGPGEPVNQLAPPGTNWVNPNPIAGFQAPASYPGYALAFSDEFEASTLDTQHWKPEVNGNGGGNNELQYYRAENAYLREGLLVIEAREESFAGRDYTSARLTTQDKFEFTYGRVDIRAALPTGQGIWPALWMLGANFPEVGWPQSGEIDIVELLGQEDDRVYGTVHWQNEGNKAQYPNTGSGGKKLNGGENYHGQYHVFSLVWQETQLEWLVDGVSYLKFDITDNANLAAFRKSFFLIFNVAVGGNWPGSPDQSTRLPQRMLVDYVRVYQAASD
jgi:beta-glucanase (GH16 family)